MLCRPARLRTMCDQSLHCQHLHSCRTKNLHERNNCTCQISRRCRILGMLSSWLPVLCMGNFGKRRERKVIVRSWFYIHIFTPELTCASHHAFRPCMAKVSATGTSAFLIPGTPRSATTDSTGSRVDPALRALHCIVYGYDLGNELSLRR